MEKASKLKDVEEEVNKGVIVFADDTEVFRVLKMRANWKKLQKVLKVLSNQVKNSSWTWMMINIESNALKGNRVLTADRQWWTQKEEVVVSQKHTQ